MEKTQNKKFITSVLIFISGCFSVSVSNVFGGYFALVSVIQMISLTVYLLTILEEKDAFKSNLVELILIGLSIVPVLVFFITNDIIGKDVYVGNLSNFWDVFVICSQIISLGSLTYVLVRFAFKFNKNHIEVVDELEKKVSEEKMEKEKVNKEKVVVEEEKTEVLFEKKEEEIEVKSISENNKEMTAPFMEEEN